MIKQINLQNFKCFENVKVKLAPFNLLSGLNGMGKSSLIQALLLLRQNYELNVIDKHLILNGELVQIGNYQDLLFQYAKSKEIIIEIETSKFGNGLWKLTLGNVNDRLIVNSVIENNDIYKSSLFSNNFHYLTAERIGPRSYYDTSTHKVINQNQMGIKGEFVANYLAEYEKISIPIKNLKHPSTQGDTLYEQLNAWLGEITPNTRIHVEQNINMSLIALTYQFIGGKDVGNNFRPINVGFGLSYILSILVAILTSKPETLILLENPEAHLHPKAQAQVGKLLALAAANGIQLIIETHSDHILNGIRVAVKEGLISPEQANFLFFKKDVVDNRIKHYILNPKINNDGQIDDWPDGFFDEWDVQLTKLLPL